MNIFDHLGEIYTEIDNSYTTIELISHSRGHFKKESEYFAKRQFNDQAYFLFMFTRLEDRVRSLSDKLIDQKLAILSDWKSKRSWEIIHKQKVNDTLHFMNRVSLLTPKGGKNFNLIKQYYDQRNNIGHGGTFTSPVIIPTVIADMKLLYKDLKG